MWAHKRLIQPSLILLVVVAMVGAACTSSGDDELTASTTASPAATSTSVGVEGNSPPTPIGATEVGIVTHLPLVAMTWDTVELPLPALSQPDVWLAAVNVSDAGYAAVAFAWAPPPDNQTVFTWLSPDGAEWTRTELKIPTGQTMDQVVVDGETLIGIGSRTVPDGYEPVLYFSDGAGGWEPSALSSSGLDLSNVWLGYVAGNEAGMVVGGNREHYTPGPPIVIEKDGYRIELHDIAGTYEVTDAESGRLVASGSQNEFYAGSEDGQAIFDLVNDELLTVVPWDIWEGMYQTGSPLPIPVLYDNQPGSVRSVEWDGYRITLDEANYRYEVVVIDTGELVVSGSMEDLYRGRPPSFVDAASGEVVLRFTWDEWDELLSAAYESSYGDHEYHEPEQIVLFSPDRKEWSEQTLTGADNTHIESVISIAGEFLVSVIEHGDYGGVRTLYTSTTGTDWTTVETSGPRDIYQAHSGPAGAIALAYAQEGSAVAISEDGRTWISDLFLGPQDDGRTGWLQLVGSGGFGQVVMGNLDPAPTSEILTITVDGRTARFGAPGSAVEITDDSTGQVLLVADWEEMERAAADGKATYASYAEGVTSFWAADGSLVLRITDAQAQAALEEQAARYQAQTSQVLFIKLDGVWYEGSTAELNGAYPQQLVVGKDSLVVGATEYRAYESQEPTVNRLTVSVGRPAPTE